MLRPAARLAIFLLVVTTVVWLWTVLPRRKPGPPPGADDQVHEITVTRLEDGRVRLVRRALGVMGTRVTLTLFGDDEAALRQASAAAFERIEALEARYSRWRKTSDVSRVNAAAGDPVEVHPDTRALVARALELGRKSGGSFDVTVGPLLGFWKTRETWPTDDEIAAVLARVGPDRVTLGADGAPTVAVAMGSSLDLGGLAKGTVVDGAAAELERRGVATFLINAGGDMLARGQDPEGRGLLVALRDPEARSGTMLEHWRFRLENAALCTSGSYERFREIDGRRVSHIVDPRSGKPVTDHVLQASVIAPDCETADALATALMVLPPAEGMAVIESLPGIEAVLVQRNGRELTFTPSSGFMALIGEESR